MKAYHNVPVSLAYTNGAPSWWGTNPWPAIDPVSAVVARTIPAQDRFNWVGGGGSSPSGSGGQSSVTIGTLNVGAAVFR